MLEATRDDAVDARMRLGTAALALAALALALAMTGVGCSKRGKASEACADIAGAACQECRNASKHRFCDAKSIAPQASDRSTVNGQKGCCGFNDPKLRAQCESILRCARKTGCAVGNDSARCLCGEVNPMSCARSAIPHTGPCAAEYRAAAVGGTPASVISVFGDPRSPIGVANNTITCDFDGACPCDQGK
jgi:hypothetical protein